jgi:hypothetical protein
MSLTDDQIAWLQRNKMMSGGGSASGSAMATQSAAPALSGSPQQMQADCKVVRNRVPGPENHLLCVTHGHIVDTQSRTIIALDLKDYLNRGLGEQHQGGHGATAHQITSAGTPPATLVHAARPTAATSADAAPAAQPAHAPPAASRQALAQPASAQPAKKLTEVNPDADRQRKAQTGGADSAITDLLDAAAKLIDNATPDKKQDLAARLTQLRADVTAVVGMTDPAKQAAARSKADTDAKQLIKDAAQAVDKGQRDEARKQVQEAYKAALSDKYGISIGKHSDMTPPNLHLDDLYDTLENVPLGHVAQNKMMDVSYTRTLMVGPKGSQHGIGRATSDGIELGAFGEETWPYNDPETKKPFIDPTTKKPERPNGFRITVLHELGHSVDKRYSVMKTGDEAYGGWAKVDGGALVTRLAAPFIAKLKGVLDETIITDAVHSAVFKGAVGTAPPDADAAAWSEISKFLGPWAAMRSSGAPWASPRLSLGDRGYVWSSNYGTWYSYSKAARDKLEATSYQWSAPAEWFAELYAIYWYKKKPPPSTIPPAMTAFLPGGSGAGDPDMQKP